MSRGKTVRARPEEPRRRWQVRARTLSRHACLAFASALLLGVYGRLPDLSAVAWVALVPWILLYTDEDRPRASLGWYVLSAWVYWMLAYPEAFRFGWYTGPIVAGLALVAFLWCFAPLLRTLHERYRLPRALTVPLAWVATEVLRSAFTVGHLEYQALGYTQARVPLLIQIADLVGVHGVSFVVAAANGLVADLIVAVRERRSSGYALHAWRLRWSAAGVLAALALTAGYGALRLSGTADEQGPRVAVVQPAVRHTLRNVIGVHLGQLLMTVRHLQPGSVDLIAWPENAILDDIEREGAYLEDLGWLARSTGAGIVLGASARVPDNPLRANNSSFLVDARGRLGGRNDKRVLFPWSEYVPFEPLLAWLPVQVEHTYLGLIRRGWGFVPNGVPARSTSLFQVPWGGTELPFVALTCWDAVYPPVAAEARRAGARFAFHLTSEGEVGGPVHEHALRYCILRAVENRMPFVRAGNTGISCFLDSRGRVRKVLRGPRGGMGEPGVLLGRAHLGSPEVPLYPRSRRGFEAACAGMAILMVGWGRLRRLRAARMAAALLLCAALAGCSRSTLPPPAHVGSPEVALAQAQRWSAQGAVHEATAAFLGACFAQETCAAALPAAAQLFRAADENHVAVEFFAEVARAHPALAAEATGYEGYFLERMSRYRESRERFERSLRGSPSARIRAFHGNLLLKAREYRAAAREYGEAARAEPAVAHYRYLLGRALRLAGDVPGARAVLEQVVQDEPGHGSAWVELARVLALQGEASGSDAALARAIGSDRANLEARYLLARAALRAGEVERSAELLEEIRGIESTLGRGPREP